MIRPAFECLFGVRARCGAQDGGVASAYADRLGRLEAGEICASATLRSTDQRARFPEPRPLYDPDGAAGLDGRVTENGEEKALSARRRDFGDFGRLKGTNGTVKRTTLIFQKTKHFCPKVSQRATGKPFLGARWAKPHILKCLDICFLKCLV